MTRIIKIISVHLPGFNFAFTLLCNLQFEKYGRVVSVELKHGGFAFVEYEVQKVCVIKQGIR